MASSSSSPSSNAAVSNLSLQQPKRVPPLFEICVTMSEEGEDKEKAIYLKHKAAPQDGKEKDSNIQLALRMFQLTPTYETTQDQWAETLTKLAAAGGKKDANKETFKELLSKYQINPTPSLIKWSALARESPKRMKMQKSSGRLSAAEP